MDGAGCGGNSQAPRPDGGQELPVSAWHDERNWHIARAGTADGEGSERSVVGAMNQRPIPPEKHGGSHQKSGSDPLRSQFLEVDHNALANQYPHHAPVPPGLVMGEEGEEGPMGPPGLAGVAGLAVAEGRPELADGSLTSYQIPGVTIIDSVGASIDTTTNRVNYYPILVATTIILDAIVVWVMDNLGTGAIRYGIYNADTDWQPTSLVVSVTDTLGTSGLRTNAVTTILTAGRYLLASLPQNTSTAQLAYYQGSMPGLGISKIIGSGAVQFMTFYVAQAYGAFPDPGTRWDNYQLTSAKGFVYPVFLRVLTP